MLPARSTELARTADLHILYRRAASAYAGAITPEVKAELWAQAEKQVPPLKEKAMIEELRSDTEAHQTDPFENVGPIPTPPPTVDVDALVEAHEGTPAPKVRVGQAIRVKQDIVDDLYTLYEDATGHVTAEAGDDDLTQVVIEGRVYFLAPDDFEVIADELPPAPKAHESVAIERPGGDATVGTAVVNPKNPAPAGMVAVQVAPGMIEAAQADEVKTLGDVLTELGKAKERIAALEHRNDYLHEQNNELRKQLDTFAHDQQMTPLARTGGVWEVATLQQDILAYEEVLKADGVLANWLNKGWQIIPQLCVTTMESRKVFLQREPRMVEPKPDAGKPTNVRDFPVPDAELTAEDDGTVSARASGLPVSASYGMGRGLAPRRA